MECIVQNRNDTMNHRRLTVVCLDLLAINGVCVAKRSLSTRIGLLRDDIVTPFKRHLKHNPEIANSLYFTIQTVRYERSYGFSAILNSIVTAANQPCRGLLFRKMKSHYLMGRLTDNHDSLLRWLNPDTNLIRFKIHTVLTKDRKPRYQLMAMRHDRYVKFDCLTVEPELAQKWKTAPVDGKMANFKYDPEWVTSLFEEGYAPEKRVGGWRFVGFCDKLDDAHNESFVNRVLKSIKEPVTLKMLEDKVGSIRAEWKRREAAQLPTDAPTTLKRKSSNMEPIKLSTDISDIQIPQSQVPVLMRQPSLIRGRSLIIRDDDETSESPLSDAGNERYIGPDKKKAKSDSIEADMEENSDERDALE